MAERHSPPAITEQTHEGLQIRWLDATVQRLQIQNGDTLVLRVPETLAEEQRANLARLFAAEFPAHRCVVLGSGMDLTAVSAPAAAATATPPDKGKK